MNEASTARKVMVADDEPKVEPLFRQRMRREVRTRGYEFLFALSEQRALAVLEENPDIRLVNTDLNMPEINDFELLDVLGHRCRTCSRWLRRRAGIWTICSRPSSGERGASW